MAAPPSHLRLERSKANLLFNSWRLSSSIAREQGALPLPAPAVPPTAADTDYVVTRHAALLNALAAQPSGAFTCFLEEHASGGEGSTQLALFQLDLGEPQHPPALRRVCGVPAPHETEVGGLSTSQLPPSAVEVQAAGGPTGLMLVSAGRGDVALALAQPRPGQQPPAAAAALSAAAWPLRPAPPLQGVRPVHLAAAFVMPPQATGGAAPSGSDQQQATADVCCIMWAPRPRSQRQASRCEVYAMRLAATLAPHPALAVRSVQLLKVSDLPPHGVLANPATGGVLLALQASAEGAEDEAAAQRIAAAAAAQPGHAAGGDDDDDVSPRSLAVAVACLQAYTSDEPAGPLPHQQYADLYREAGADGVGAMGSEPTCTLFTFAPAAAGVDAARAAPAGAATAGQPLLRLAHTLSCQPHKLLTCHLQPPAFGAQEPPTPDTHLAVDGGSGGKAAEAGGAGTPGGGQAAGPTLLLGLTDDVDCAVVAVSCADASDAGVGSSDAAAGGGDSGGGDSAGGGAGFVVRHAASIPALAYVAAGKVQRKFILLAPPGGDLAGVLAEAIKYCYLYRATGSRQEIGEHQVVDMELPDGSGCGLLGAALAGGRAGGTRLVLLAREGLRLIDM
ncbi:hypothetical protein C2E20_5843 [Micractinium conductrix]|uniref:Uncharacterized protein n=1 Tax=Micractinium conductrix TaxID=554055 RepID=A0A2P6V9D6_9CHLO|nr:hypothetical protein C2E20_5843 [Micractinium conductrix]|eukprot:PSC70698.1 hypothetical protein C2E20_5843 [Micractinium conductrix]